LEGSEIHGGDGRSSTVDGIRCVRYRRAPFNLVHEAGRAVGGKDPAGQGCLFRISPVVHSLSCLQQQMNQDSQLSLGLGTQAFIRVSSLLPLSKDRYRDKARQKLQCAHLDIRTFCPRRRLWECRMARVKSSNRGGWEFFFFLYACLRSRRRSGSSSLIPSIAKFRKSIPRTSSKRRAPDSPHGRQGHLA
jgi:hypothetical protein